MAYFLGSDLTLNYALHTDPDPVRVSKNQDSTDASDRSLVDLTLVISSPPEFHDGGRPMPRPGGPTSITITLFDGNTPLELTSSFHTIEVSSSFPGVNVSGPDNEGRIVIKPENDGEKITLGSEGALVKINNVLVNDAVGTAFIQITETPGGPGHTGYFKIAKLDFEEGRKIKLFGEPISINHSVKYTSNYDGVAMLWLSSNPDGKEGFKQYEITSGGVTMPVSAGLLTPSEDPPKEGLYVDKNSALMPVTKGEEFEISKVQRTGGVGSIGCYFVPMNVDPEVRPVVKEV